MHFCVASGWLPLAFNKLGGTGRVRTRTCATSETPEEQLCSLPYRPNYAIVRFHQPNVLAPKVRNLTDNWKTVECDPIIHCHKKHVDFCLVSPRSSEWALKTPYFHSKQNGPPGQRFVAFASALTNYGFLLSCVLFSEQPSCISCCWPFRRIRRF